MSSTMKKFAFKFLKDSTVKSSESLSPTSL